MRKVLSNRLLWRGSGGWLADARRAWVAGLAFVVLLLGPWLGGVCSCTMFEIGALVLVLAAALTGGNSVYGAITGEREKKTLDSLLLTQLSPTEVLVGKLAGELGALGRLLLASLPALLVLATLGGLGLKALGLTLLVAALAGLFASVSGLFVSSLASTTSQAVMAGWALKGVWLLGTPVLDLVVQVVLVQREPVPVFTLLNPLAAVFLGTVPEAAGGPWAGMGLRFAAAIGVTVLAMGWTAVRRLERDGVGGAQLEGHRVHAAWRPDWWVLRLAPGLSRNAAFLREAAFQARSGGASWPGFLVFLVLFLAPFFYALAWTRGGDAGPASMAGPPPGVVISTEAPEEVLPALPPARRKTGHDAYIRVPGRRTTLVFHGHEPATCLRLALYQRVGIPMPGGSVSVVVVPEDTPVALQCPSPTPEIREPGLVAPEILAPFGMGPREPAPSRFVASDRGGMFRALQVGLAGTLVLFLLYLGVRCAGFLAGAVTGEWDRRSWQDLALTGMPAARVLQGKLWGALGFPLLQMTLVFPVLSLYLFTDSLNLFELVGLYVYSVALAVTAGLVGLWASAGSSSTHRSHGKALGFVLGATCLGPLVGALLPVWLLLLGAFAGLLLALARGSRTWAGWLALAVGLLLAPWALSPWTAAVGFIPSLEGGGAELMSALEVAPDGPGQALAGFLGALLVLGGLSLILWRSALRHVAEVESSPLG